MTKRQSAPSQLRGFTLLELLMVVAVLGILSVIAVPSYQRYVNEAKAADVLVKVHEVALAYHDIIATSPGELADHHGLSSGGFGQAPALLPGMGGMFAAHRGISMSAQMVNHSGFFQYTGHEAFPVLFLKADTAEGNGILRALDHVTQFKHTFVTPNMMMIALAMPHEAHTANKQPLTSVAPSPAVTPTPTPNPTPTPIPTRTRTPEPNKTPQQVPQLAPGATPGATPGAASALVAGPLSGEKPDNSAPTGGSGGNPAPANGGAAASNSGGTGGGGAAGAGSPVSHLNWPPGWVKHPDQHQGDHPGQHHGQQNHHGNH